MTTIADIVKQLEAQKSAIERALSTLYDFAQTGGASASSAKSTPGSARGRKRGMSEEGRRRLALAMKRRWAAKRTAGQAKKAPAKAAPKRQLTPEGRKRLAQAMKRRWAAKRSAAQAKKSA